MVYYSENDPFAAAWLRNLIAAGQIADGVVDERDVRDVTPADVRPYRQAHFFAGVGTWSYALRLAGWADDLPCWTGSCPCQPFSQAGKGEGVADERHLWPAFYHLIRECRPHVVIGEQVSSKDGLAWFDVVSSDLEAAGYATGALDTSAAGVGAPHIRQRLYWVAHTSSIERNGRRTEGMGPEGFQHASECGRLGVAQGDANSNGAQRAGREERIANAAGTPVILGDANIERLERRCVQPGPRAGERPAGETGHPDGFWSDAEWIYCRDGKTRPVKSGLRVLANGTTHRVGKLRGYGNSLCAPQAAAFVASYIEAVRDSLN